MTLVYFIRCGVNGPIKIGTTTDLPRRLRELDCGPEPLTVIGTFPGNQRLEKSIHRALVPHRQRLEWFRPCPEVLDFVERSLSDPACVPELVREFTARHEAHLARVAEDAAHASSAANWAVDRICRREGVVRVAAVAEVSGDQVSRYRNGKAKMGVVAFLRLQAAWPDDFALVELILGLPHLSPEEVRANRSTLENARDAIEQQLGKLRPDAA